MVFVSSRKMKIWAFIFLIPYVYGGMTGRISKCEANRAMICKGLYNETRFPNKKEHRSQDDAISDLNQYKALISTGCAQHLRLFLCATFIPMCTILEEHILPCRSLCYDVKGKCEKILLKYVGLEWPNQLACAQYPETSSGKLCIGDVKPTKAATQKVAVSPNKRTKVNDNQVITLQCDKTTKINFKKIIHDNKVCTRSVSQDILRKLCNSEQTCEFQLKHVVDKVKQPFGCVPGKVGSSSIKYTCVAEHHNIKQVVLKYGQDENIYCKSPSRHISILGADFKDDTCVTPNAFCSVSQSCTGKKNCVLWANDHYLPSQCKGENMKLSVSYACVKSRNEEEMVEEFLDGAGIELKCAVGKSLSIVRAEYVSLCQSKEIHCAVDVHCGKKDSCLLLETNLDSVKCSEGRSKVRIRYICT